jgi:hypothetical protein
MKKINFKFFGIFIVLLCVFSNQVFAELIIIRKDDPAPGGGSNVASATKLSSLKSLSLQSQFVIPVTADITGSDLIVDFTTTVGTANVSVVDQNGNIVYQTVVDTSSTPEIVIPVDGLSSGDYSLKISYGSTDLIGDFQL